MIVSFPQLANSDGQGNAKKASELMHYILNSFRAIQTNFDCN